MPPTFRPGFRVVLSGLLAVAAVAGCRVSPNTTLSASSVAAPRATGNVRVDLSGLFASLKGRHVLGQGFSTPAITQVRLRAMGPGMAETQSAAVAYSPTGAVPAAPIALAVTAGINRVFQLEAVDAQGHALATMLSLADVPAGANLALTFDGNTNVAGNVLHELLFPTQADEPAGVAPWNATSVVAPLLAFVDRITDLDEATHQFKRVDPLAVDQHFLIDTLRANGPTYLTTTPSLPTQLSEEVWGSLTLQHTIADGVTLYGDGEGSVSCQLFDPLTSTLTTSNAAGEYRFTHVPVGHYWLKTQLMSAGTDASLIWQEVDVQPETYLRYPVYQMPKPPAMIAASGLAPAIAGKPDGSLELRVWRDGAAIRGQFADAQRQPVGAPLSIGASATEAPEVVYNPVNDEFLVVWGDATNQQIFAQRVAADGTMIGTPDAFSTTPSAAFTLVPPPAPTYSAAAGAADGGYVLAWTNGEQVATRKLSPAAGGLSAAPGSPLSFVSDTAHPIDHASIAYNAATDSCLLAWEQMSSGMGKDVLAQLVNATTGASLPIQTVTAGGSGLDEGSPHVIAFPANASSPLSPTQFMIGWEYYDSFSNTSLIKVQDFDGSTSAMVGVPLTVSTGGFATRPRLSYLHKTTGLFDRVMVTWRSLEGGAGFIRARGVQADGASNDPRGQMTINKSDPSPIDGAMPAVFVHPADGTATVVWGDLQANAPFVSVIP